MEDQHKVRLNIATYYFTHQSDEEEEKEIKVDKEAKQDKEVSPDETDSAVTTLTAKKGQEASLQPPRLVTANKLYYSTEDIHALASRAELLVLTSSPPTETDSCDSSDSDYGSRTTSLQTSSHPNILDRTGGLERKTQSLGKVWRKSLPEYLECYTAGTTTALTAGQLETEQQLEGSENKVEMEEWEKKEVEEDERKEVGEDECSVDEGGECEESGGSRESEGSRGSGSTMETCSAMGSWDHDLQEQYISEGNSLEFQQDTTLRSVLCFGEDYSRALRRGEDISVLESPTSPVEGAEGGPPTLDNSPTTTPTTLLRMSERDWVLANQEVEEVEGPSPFGDKDSYERLIATCQRNADLLSSMGEEGPPQSPRDKGGDFRDLEESWSVLCEDLKKRLSQWEAYNTINTDIAVIQGDLDLITSWSHKFEAYNSDKVGLPRDLDTITSHDMEEDGGNDLGDRQEVGGEDLDIWQIKYQEGLEELEKNVKPALQQTTASVQLLNSEVSALQPDHVQKIALLCFCKQELISLSELWSQAKANLRAGLHAAEQAEVARDQLELHMLGLERVICGNNVVPRNKAITCSFIPASRRLRLSQAAELAPLSPLLDELITRLSTDLRNLSPWLTQEYAELAKNFLQGAGGLLDRGKEGPNHPNLFSLNNLILLSSFALVLISVVLQAVTSLCTLVQSLAKWPVALWGAWGQGVGGGQVS